MWSGFLSFFAKNQKPPEWAASNLKTIDKLQDEDTAPAPYQQEIHADNDILGQSFGINYVSSKGEKSDRWISVIRIMGEGKNISLFAYCYVRERPRQFRLDRISTVYDADGTLINCAEFFGSFGLSYKEAPLLPQKPGAFLKRKMKDEARLLVAIARIDGKFSEEELDEILMYFVKKAESRGEFQNEDDIAAFENYLHNLYPTVDVLDGCFRRLKKYTKRGKQDLLQMCARVMDADGIETQSEFNLIMEIKEELYRSTENQ